MNTAPQPRPNRILIVEDELLVRMFAVDTLEDAGFEVAQAGDAAEALSALNGSGTDEFTAVIVDLGLPDRSGDQLAMEIRALRPSAPIVIASGRSERELKERFSGDKAIAILVKPYTSTLLLDALESLGIQAPNPQ
jgi:DNA-binding response OmpR family regulator